MTLGEAMQAFRAKPADIAAGTALRSELRKTCQSVLRGFATADAEDALQNCLIKLWTVVVERPGAIGATPGEAAGYAVRTAERAALDVLRALVRRGRRFEEPEDDPGDVDAEVGREAAMRDLHRVVATLRDAVRGARLPQYRAAFDRSWQEALLYGVEGLTAAQVLTMMDADDGDSVNALHRRQKRLREELERTVARLSRDRLYSEADGELASRFVESLYA